MNMNIEKIGLIISLICIVIMYFEINNLKKNNLENFNNNNIEHMTDVDEERVRDIVKEEYNHDIEAIRNLGTISKSLLTGKNYHNTSPTDLENNTLTIPANVRILGNITVEGNGEIGAAYIGSSKSHGGGFAEFSHRVNDSSSYSIIAAADGQLYLNTKGGNYIGFRHNNYQSLRIHPDVGHFHANGIINSDKNVHVKEDIKVDGEALNSKMLNNIKLRTFATKNRTKTRYVRIQSNNNWMHFRRFWVYTTDGKELIQELHPNNTYKIPDANFRTNHGGHTLGLHSGHRQAYKVRPPYGNHNSGGGWEHYYHSLRHTRDWWQVDLGGEYEILRVGYDYRHNHDRQWSANPAGVDTLQLLNNAGHIWKSMPFSWHATEYLPDDHVYNTWYNVPDG